MSILQQQITPNIGPALNFDLYYHNNYSRGRGTFDFLHLARSRALLSDPFYYLIEDAYWNGLESNRRGFANGLQREFDLLIDAPSNSGYHRPFLAAFRFQYDVRCLHLLKNTHVRSTPENIDAIRDHVSVHRNDFGNLAAALNVLVVDDVYCSGTIFTVVVEKLRAAGLPHAANFTLACPLRMPPVAPEPDFTAEVEAIEAMDHMAE